MFLSSVLWTGVTFASFHLFGKCLVIRLMLKIAHILFKLKKMGIVGNLLLWFKDYLTNRNQRVVINGKEWEQRNRSIISNYVFIHFFVDRGDVCQFPFIWKMFSYQTNVKNSTQWFRNNIVLQ
jgi:hypothetical protein